MELTFFQEGPVNQTAIQDIVTQIIHLSPELLLIVCLNVIGYVLKFVKPFPNNLIPGAVILAGAIVYPLITSPGQAPPEATNPFVVLAMQGLLIGFLAWVIHNKFLVKLEDWLLSRAGDDSQKTSGNPPSQPDESSKP